MNRANFFNNHQSFPVSTRMLDFMQAQMALVANYAKAAGGNCILSGCTDQGASVTDGVLILGGEIIEFVGGVKQTTVRIVETTQSETAAGITYHNAYTFRTAEFGSNLGGAQTFAWEDIVPLPANAAILAAVQAEIAARQNADTNLVVTLQAEIAALQNADTNLAETLKEEIAALQTIVYASANLTVSGGATGSFTIQLTSIGILFTNLNVTKIVGDSETAAIFTAPSWFKSIYTKYITGYWSNGLVSTLPYTNATTASIPFSSTYESLTLVGVYIH
jgi:hypothetical protein